MGNSIWDIVGELWADVRAFASNFFGVNVQGNLRVPDLDDVLFGAVTGDFRRVIGEFFTGPLDAVDNSVANTRTDRTNQQAKINAGGGNISPINPGGFSGAGGYGFAARPVDGGIRNAGKAPGTAITGGPTKVMRTGGKTGGGAGGANTTGGSGASYTSEMDILRGNNKSRKKGK